MASMLCLVALWDYDQEGYHSLNVNNLSGRSCYRNYPLWENGPKWLIKKNLKKKIWKKKNHMQNDVVLVGLTVAVTEP